MPEQFNFNDVFNENFLNVEEFARISIINIVIPLIVSFLIGLFIFWIYKKTYQGVVYSHNFNMTLVLMTMITTIVIMTISTNIVLSLGMVGALSIVRFRTAIKDPLDIVFMFWAISVGIAAGARFYEVVTIGSIFVGIVIVLLSKKKTERHTYLLIVQYNMKAYYEVKQELNKLKTHTIKSKITRDEITELTVELKLKIDNTTFVDKISTIEGVQDVSLVQYNGNYAT
ncbi:DUF4956 domain-containing protein [Aquibacillus albus]|uniref:Membrane protein YhiD involved in acid resistance n=1 Tax=Aquibacillus albus TaxID=1168171 RepID=A0ABS2MVV3_9BACI|nr:DUF4956 domain-containing protein [Aquibacillus albus]MBM7569999.1 putative membrane protein YhiD involved in acid resistance [Aquibacillus albus]